MFGLLATTPTPTVVHTTPINNSIVVFVVLIVGVAIFVLWKARKSVKKGVYNLIDNEVEKAMAEYRKETTKVIKEFKELNRNNEKRYNKLQEQVKTTQKHIYKLQIVDTELPKEERLKAWDRYKALGGNSYIEDYVNKNLLK